MGLKMFAREDRKFGKVSYKNLSWFTILVS